VVGASQASAPAPSAADVAHYYDANTRRFLFVGPRGGVHSIHRELWGPGVTTAAESVDYVNGLLAEEIRTGRPDRGRDDLSILDLGCGVGGTMMRLAELLPASHVVGVTISPRQVEIGRRLVGQAGLSGRCAFVLGDMRSVAAGHAHDAVVAVESFVHVDSGSDFFDAAARALRPGGLLLVVDDFLAHPLEELDVAQLQRVDDFRQGWRVPGLSTVESARVAGAAAGFEFRRFEDLSALVRTGRPRDRLISALAPAFRALQLSPVPFFGNMIGGDALQKGLQAGTLRYGMAVFRLEGAHGHTSPA